MALTTIPIGSVCVTRWDAFGINGRYAYTHCQIRDTCMPIEWSRHHTPRIEWAAIDGRLVEFHVTRDTPYITHRYLLKACSIDPRVRLYYCSPVPYGSDFGWLPETDLFPIGVLDDIPPVRSVLHTDARIERGVLVADSDDIDVQHLATILEASPIPWYLPRRAFPPCPPRVVVRRVPADPYYGVSAPHRVPIPPPQTFKT